MHTHTLAHTYKSNTHTVHALHVRGQHPSDLLYVARAVILLRLWMAGRAQSKVRSCTGGVSPLVQLTMHATFLQRYKQDNWTPMSRGIPVFGSKSLL